MAKGRIVLVELLNALWVAAVLGLYVSNPNSWCTERGTGLCRAFRDWTYTYRADAAAAAFLLFYPLSYLARRSAWPVHCLGASSLLACLLYLKLTGKDLEEFFVITAVVTGRGAAVTCGVFMLSVCRRTVLTSPDGAGYMDLVGLHRAAGWWCVAYTVIHSLGFSAYFFMRRGWTGLACELLPLSCYSRMNVGGLVNFLGLIGTASAVVLALLSLEKVRRRRYEVFYLVHLAAAVGFLLFGALHDFQMLLLMLPGLCFYMLDRLSARWQRPADLQVQLLCGSSSSSIVLLSWGAEAGCKAEPGHRWVSLCAEAVSRLEWHPFSAFECRGRRHVLVKGLGDWSKSVCDLVASGRPLSLKVQGPFGRPYRAQNAAPRGLLLIAGGVGVAPFADLLHSLQKDCPWRRLRLLWAVRQEEYLALAPCLALQDLSCVADVTVFITTPDCEAAPAWELAMPPAQRAERVVAHGRSRALYFLACLPVLCCLVASLRLYDLLGERLRHVVTTLPSYMLFRLAPVLAALCLALPGGAGLLAAPALLPKAGRRGELAQQLTVEQHPPAAAQLHVAKPNLREEMAAEAGFGALDVQVCGPERMVEAARVAARSLAASGLDVSMEVHDPAM